MILSGKVHTCTPGCCRLGGADSILLRGNLYVRNLFPDVCVFWKTLAQEQRCSISHGTVFSEPHLKRAVSTSAGASRCHLRLDRTCWDAARGDGFQTGLRQVAAGDVKVYLYCVPPVPHGIYCWWPNVGPFRGCIVNCSRIYWHLFQGIQGSNYGNFQI